MALTKDQQSAVDVRDRTLLVSAAAGSGKTYTLTQRIIKAIINEKQDLSRLLIVTFTRAAAGELKAKIAKALGDAIAEHPGDSHLQNQMIKLGNAHISTIDSFFADPVRANFEKLGLPASMRLSDDAELSPIRDKIMQETLGIFFSRCEPYENESLSPVGYSNRYTELIGIITGARDTSKLLPTFWDIYKRLITSPRSLEQLRDHAKRLAENSKKDFFQTLEGNALRDELASTVRYAWRTFIKCSEDMQNDPFVASRYTSDFVDNATLCHTLLCAIENGIYNEVCRAFEEYKPAKITSVSAKEKTERSEYYKNLRTSLNTKVRKLATDYLYRSDKELSALFAVYSDMCALLYDILSEFERRYTEEKRRRGVCEFADMPKFMLSLLVDNDGKPTEYAKTLSESFDEVYIDEYQDVNEIQDTIFALIGKRRRFMVGDIKQSIYGFREAEPSIFAEYRRKFPIYNEKNDAPPTTDEGGSTIFMSENFRCDENIIKFTNTVCSGVFSAFSDSIGYTAADDLKFGKGNPTEEYASPAVTLNIVQTPPDAEDDVSDEEGSYQDDDAASSSENAKNLGDEAIVVANQIAELLRTAKNADGTPITPGDVAILVRSHAHNKPIINALGALNIKYALSSKGELFETEDMRLLVNLLSVIDNPRSDMPLCHILTTSSDVHTPDFTLEEIVKVRRFADRSKSLYDALIEYSVSGDDKDIASRCSVFIAHVERMRAAAGRISADKLVKSLISSEKYSSLTTTDAYTYLYDSACKFVKNTWSSLYSFIKYFKDVMEKGEAGVEPDTKSRDAVTIMSIHQSKGLEFNVCFLFGFGKRFNMQNRYSIIFNKEFGPSMKLPPSRDADADVLESISMRYENNPIYKTVDRYNKAKQLEEEARIFYVALTRARERLYISATLSKPHADCIARLSECADREYEIKKSRTYINWILLMLLGTDESVYSVNVYDKNKEHLTRQFARGVSSSSEREISDEEIRLADLISLSASEEDERILSTVPSKVAASKVSPHMLDDSIFSPIPTGKLFSDSDEDANEPGSDTERIIRSRIELMRTAPSDFDSLLEINKKPTATEIGTATHAFLQFCDYKNAEKNGLESEIERLKDQKFITERTASIINKKQLDGFFKSDLYGLISSAKAIHREFRFGMFRQASDFTENDGVKELVKDKKIYVQGSIDLIIETENGEIVLCDYKTDRLTKEERSDRELLLANMKQKHGEQLSQYGYAVKQIFGKEPKQMYIYSLALGEAIEIK